MVSTDTSSDHNLRPPDEVVQRFTANYRDYIRRVSAALHRRFPSLRGRIEEIAQEALCRTLDAWLSGRIASDRDPLPYMHRTARNLANDAVTSKEQPMDSSDLFVLIDQNVLAQHEVGTSVDPMQEVVLPAIASMKQTRRKTVAQGQAQGQGEETLAADLHIPRQQVRSLSSKAARELQSMDEVKPHIRQQHLKKRRRGEEDTGE
jgi:DNA-directed RNA polymerase specialized sigma24 family protein